METTDHSVAPEMEATHHGLKPELKLWDLILLQVLLVVGLNLTGFAAKLGPSQLLLWFLAIGLFYLPQAAVVMKLSRAIPVEGGVYQWVKEGISPFAGYMAGWSYFVYAIGYFASFGTQLANGIAYGGGPNVAWMANSKGFALTSTVVVCVLAFFLNVVGFQITKWLSGTASLVTIATFVVLLYLLLQAVFTGHATGHSTFSVAWPAFSILSLSVFTKMALFMLSGFDQAGIIVEECRKPKNDVARSVLIAAPLIAIMYVVVTYAISAYIAPANVDLAAPISQVIQAGFGESTLGKISTTIVVAGFNFSQVAILIVILGIVSRLPMAAGWDGLLPSWWGALHPKYKTPFKAIAAVTASVMLMGVVNLLGTANEEAVQVLLAAAFGSYCIMYMLLFGQVVFGFRSSVWRPGIGIRLGALAAFLVVVAAFALQVVPLGEVASPGRFAVKVAGTICVANAIGIYLYWAGKRRGRNAEEVAG
jgi:amino acid transporter